MPVAETHKSSRLLGGPPLILNIQARLVDQEMKLENAVAGIAVNEEINAEMRRLKEEMEDTVKNLRKEQDDVTKAAYRSHRELQEQSRKFEEVRKQLSDDRTKEAAVLNS
ncbi:MAG: hypothetical protein M1839_000223 [Geoglossum umbratile]|nr:MAG: hypothetical protein M1839_000223 [Geoglossum umbratile]